MIAVIAWYVPKTISVRTEPPYTVICEYETGEIKSYDMTNAINKNPELAVLKDNPELFAKAEVSLCDYMIQWLCGGKLVSFHGDYIYSYGKTLKQNGMDLSQ